jgi:5-hydroxyisourate hydrolase-like protein (transthyretin family)
MIEILFLAAAAAQAPQQPKSVSRSEFIAQTDTAFAQVDTNHDGFISASEMQAAQQRDLEKVQAAARAKLEAEFKQLDTNHDGQLSMQEFLAIATVRPNQTPQQLVQQFDTNHDGKISAQEFRAVRLQIFDKADTNHDGVITPAEAAAAAGKK